MVPLAHAVYDWEMVCPGAVNFTLPSDKPVLVLHSFSKARVSGVSLLRLTYSDSTYCVLSVLKPNFAVRVPRTGSPSNHMLPMPVNW